VVILLMCIYSFGGYCWLFYWWLLVFILLMAISSCSIGACFRLNYHRLLMVIGGY
jgi:uncharacterized membrane protein